MTETVDVLRAFGQRLVSDHPLGNHLCGGRRILVKCPSQVLGESVLAALPPPSNAPDTMTREREAAVIKGLRKLFTVNPDAELIDANIVRLLLDRYDADPPLTAEQRLREIDLLWAQSISQGRSFFADPSVVPRMRELLAGYDHPDTLPDEAWVCPNCNGSGLDTTWHEGAPCAETHQCGYCAGDTAQPLTPAPPPWTDCPQHPPLATPGPHGFCSCEDRERRFREMTRACQDPLSRYATVADLARAVMNAAGGHDALGRCAAPHLPDEAQRG